MAQDSTNIIARVGGESKVTTLFGNIVNSLRNSNSSAQDVTTKILNQYGGEVRQISPAKYDYIYGIFQKETESEQLAKAYTSNFSIKEFLLNPNLASLSKTLATTIVPWE